MKLCDNPVLPSWAKVEEEKHSTTLPAILEIIYPRASIPRESPWLFRENHRLQWADSAIENRSIFAIPNCPHISFTTSGWRRHSPGRGPVRDSGSAAFFATPGMYTALIDRSFSDDQESSFFVSWRHRAHLVPPWRLMWNTVDILSVLTKTYLLCNNGRKALRGKLPRAPAHWCAPGSRDVPRDLWQTCLPKLLPIPSERDLLLSQTASLGSYLKVPLVIITSCSSKGVTSGYTSM